MEETIKIMKDLLEVQGRDGNWNYDSYMMGMYNGMELMLSIVEDREPVYKEAPDEWIENKTYKDETRDSLMKETVEANKEALSRLAKY
jgi:hypothetical protein